MNDIPNELHRVLGRLYEPGETIFSQGEKADTLYVIQKGKVEIVCDIPGGQHRMRVLRAGEMFGEAATFTADKRRIASARAITKARILTIDERTLLSRLHQDPGLSFRLLRHMAQRIQDHTRERTELLKISKKVTRRKQLKSVKRKRKLPNVHNFSVAYHILIIEDDPDFSRLLKQWFKQADDHQSIDTPSSESPSSGPLRADSLPSSFNVTCVSSLKAGLARMAKEKFDACLLDLNLPDSRGILTFHLLAENYPDTPIVILTAQDDDHCAASCVQEGAQDFLVKQRVKGDLVRHAVKFAVERHRQISANDHELENNPESTREEEPTWLQESRDHIPFAFRLPQGIRKRIEQWGGA